MKWLIAVLTFILGLSAAHAQNCSDKKCFKKGTKLTYGNFKDTKSVSKETHEVMSVDATEAGLEATINSTSTNISKNKETPTVTYKIICKGSSILIDLKGLIDQEVMKNMGPGSAVEIKLISSENIDFPHSAEIATVLKNAQIKMKILLQGNEIGTVSVLVKNRKVEAKEKIETPAGIFESLKISGEVEITTIVFGQTQKQSTRSTTWVNENVGPVKTENYSSSGKIDNTRLLTKVE